MKALPLVVAALIASALVPTTHANAPDSAERSRVVRIADLDLTKESDQKRLRQRISVAAHTVCWTPGVATSIYALSMHRCTRDTTQHALDQVNASIRLGAAK